MIDTKLSALAWLIITGLVLVVLGIVLGGAWCLHQSKRRKVLLARYNEGVGAGL